MWIEYTHNFTGRKAIRQEEIFKSIGGMPSGKMRILRLDVNVS